MKWNDLAYTPYGDTQLDLSDNTGYQTPHQFAGYEKDQESGLSYAGARYYNGKYSIFTSVDPMWAAQPWQSSYAYCSNNPIMRTDPNGLLDDWVEINGKIVWDADVTSQETAKSGQKWLGKNVLVGTHSRNKNLNEPINSARFDLYAESNKDGPIATIYGNTIPADVDKYGTLSEGLYKAKGAKYKGNDALLINNGGNLPTVRGNPNNAKNYNSDGSLKALSEHVMDEVFFHIGNTGVKSLTYNNGKSVITAGCQTGPHGPDTRHKYNQFAKNLRGFNGSYYLRSNSVYNTNFLTVFAETVQSVIDKFKK